MKLLYCCHADNYHIEKWVPALEREGLDIHILTLRPSSILKTNQTVIQPLFKSKITWLDFWVMGAKIRQTFFDQQCDALLCSFASTYGLAGKFSGVHPFFVQTWSRDIQAERSTYFKDSLISSLISRKICANAQGITTDGPHFKTHVQQHWSEIDHEKILSTWWGIDTQFWDCSETEKTRIKKELGLDNFDQILISPRGLFWYYRPNEVLKSMLELSDTLSKTAFIVPSLGHQTSEETEQLKKEARIRKNIRLIDFLMSPDEFRKYLIVSDFLLSVPLFDGVSEVIQEGMLNGAIPILNPIPANKLFEDQGAIIRFTSSEQPKSKELSETIFSMLNEKKSTLDAMRQINRNFILNYCNVEKTAKELITFLQKNIK